MNDRNIIICERLVRSRLRRNLLLTLLSLSILAFLVPAVAAQDDDTDDAPPPIKIVPRSEKDELTSEQDLKIRTKTYLSLMEGHIETAEKRSTDHDANGAFKELGMFEALMDDSITVLEKGDTTSNKTLDALRKLEIGLRAYMPRLETIRRILPLNCDSYVRRLMGHLREARAKAIDPMFSDNVVKPKTAQNL